MEEIAELLAGLAKRPSRFSHLKKNDDYAEYWYEFADTKKKERKKESAMQATSTSYLGLNVETMTDLAQDLGSEVVVAEGQPPSKKHKANSKLGLPAPSPKKGADPPSAEKAKPEMTLGKVELAREVLLKQARATLKQLEELAKDPEKSFLARPWGSCREKHNTEG